MNPILNGIVGGWRTNGIWRFNSGRPIDPVLYQCSRAFRPMDLNAPTSLARPTGTGGKDSDWIQSVFHQRRRKRLFRSAGAVRDRNGAS